jgi:hemoglobin-like flavoprotein
MITVAPSPFEIWAKREGYDITPAVLPSAIRQYADRETQALFNAWTAAGRVVAQMVTESTLDTEALREKLKAIACS